MIPNLSLCLYKLLLCLPPGYAQLRRHVKDNWWQQGRRGGGAVQGGNKAEGEGEKARQVANGWPMADGADSRQQVRLWAVDDSGVVNSSAVIAILLICDRAGVFVVSTGSQWAWWMTVGDCDELVQGLCHGR
jgi:hypothetical protein